MSGNLVRSSRSIVRLACGSLCFAMCGAVRAADPVTPVPRLNPGATASALLAMDELQAKKSATSPSAEAIVFDGPPGDGRGGAKGVLFKAPTSLPGNTWTFRYTRGGSAFPLQIIHPNRGGQVIIHLNKAGVGVSSPATWKEVGYGAGSDKVLEKAEGFDTVFPLKDDVEYQVVSRMGGRGHYEMLIDGKLVIYGTLEGYNKLSLEIPEGKGFPGKGRGVLEFKGPDLPLQWAPGWVALFVGPIDSGTNACRAIRFFPAFADGGGIVANAKPFNPKPGGQQTNLLKNGWFEAGTEGWESHSWGNAATIAKDPAEAHEGHASVRIDNEAAADSYLNQAVTLKPDTRYRLSGWIKAKNIVKAEGQRTGAAGACLAVLGGYDQSENVIDSKEWKYVSLDFSTGTKTELKVGPRLGHYGKLVTGSAWFADISLVELGAIASVAPPPKRLPPPGATPTPAIAKPAAPPALSTADLVKANRSNLVFVTTPTGAGSGFIASYTAGTFLITNAHVAAGAKGAVFKTLDNTQVQVGTPAAAVGHDIFRMALPAGGTPLQIMTGVDENSAIGDEVVVLGNAEGAGVINTITGKIVGLGPNLVEVDAPFQPGNSGSPIIHLKTGKVIGVATYLTVRKYDSATKEAVKEPIIRRFGYRLDSVRIWQPANWQAFYAQATEMESIEKLTNDLANFLRDLGKEGRITRGAHTNPVIKNRIDAWLEAKSKRLSPRDAAMADQSMLSFLKLTCQSDVTAAEPRLSYDYFQRQLADQQRERTEIAGIFGKIMENLR